MDASASDIKSLLSKLIAETEDINLLNRVKSYFLALKSNEADWWNSLSENEKEQINIGVSQLDNGEKVSHKDIQSKVNQLLRPER